MNLSEAELEELMLEIWKIPIKDFEIKHLIMPEDAFNPGNDEEDFIPWDCDRPE